MARMGVFCTTFAKTAKKKGEKASYPAKCFVFWQGVCRKNMKWNLQLTTGHSLRSAILIGQSGLREDVAHVMDSLMTSVKEVINRAPSDKVLFAFEEFESVIDGEGELIRADDPLIGEMGFDNPTELVDDRLEQFYDLCDHHRVWVGISRNGSF